MQKVDKNKSQQKWQHPGGKLRERGADTLTDAELLAILTLTIWRACT
jgi:DNA repair protein RadC